jgi:hypothetical protein
MPIAEFKFEDLYGVSFDIEGGATVTFQEMEIKPPKPGEFDIWLGNLPVDTQLSLDQPFKFIVTWKQTGALCEDLRTDAYWQIEVLMEKMGIEEYELPERYRVKTVNFVPEKDHIYLVEFDIDERVVDKGVYRPVVIVNLRKPDTHDTYMPVAGFAEFSPVQFYED